VAGEVFGAPPLAETAGEGKGASGSAAALFAGFAVTGGAILVGFLAANGSGAA
jgi:hypothetical protein